MRRVEAGVDPPPRGMESADQLRVPARAGGIDLPCQPAARCKIDPHPEEARRRLREDLGQSRGVGDVVAGDHVRSAGTLEEHDRLEQVGIEPASGSGLLDQGPKRGGAPRRRRDAARTLCEKRVAEAECCGALVRRPAPLLERKRVRSHDLAGQTQGRGLFTFSGESEGDTGDSGYRHDADERSESNSSTSVHLLNPTHSSG